MPCTRYSSSSKYKYQPGDQQTFFGESCFFHSGAYVPTYLSSTTTAVDSPIDSRLIPGTRTCGNAYSGHLTCSFLPLCLRLVFWIRLQPSGSPALELSLSSPGSKLPTIFPLRPGAYRPCTPHPPSTGPEAHTHPRSHSANNTLSSGPRNRKPSKSILDSFRGGRRGGGRGKGP